MKHRKWFSLAFFTAFSICMIFFLFRPALMVHTEKGIICAVPAQAGLPFTIHFIHSVQKTPVEENLIVNSNRDGFLLQSTRYQSFGVGLPFLEGEGNFREDGDYFIFDNMNRPFHDLTLRTGVGTELTLTVDGTVYRLYEMVPLGHRIDLYIAPYYKRFLNYYTD